SYSATQAHEAATAAVASYRKWIAAYAEMSAMDVWYSRVTYAEVLRGAKDDRRLTQIIKGDFERAQRSTSEHVYGKLTTERDGQLRIVDRPPLLFHLDHDLTELTERFTQVYVETLREDYRALFRQFRWVDTAMKVVGVGSVGTRCLVALMLDQHNEPMF